MRVAVTGSSGLIGRELVAELGRRGHEVTRLVRRQAGGGEAAWDPSEGTIEAEKLEGHDGVVHLAGVGIGDRRWTDEHKRAVRNSRVHGTTLLARTLAALAHPPNVLVSGSAVGYYGYESGDAVMTEASPRGRGFLAEVVEAWEEAAAPAADAGIRIVNLRSGVVLTAKGGALKKQLLPFKLGVGGRLGTGKQWLSWITLQDEVAVIMHLLTTPDVHGPVNVTSPAPVTNGEFTAMLARALKRPAFMPVPNLALYALFGKQMTEEMLLGGQRVLPAVLEGSGFTFSHPRLDEALRAMLRPPGRDGHSVP
ncbi:MAG: TIGR01777 family oxidoreductase [Actinomycetota bacterium]|nr:TIGR01777 family oxidoreductase [Actinomycetota bacterium]